MTYYRRTNMFVLIILCLVGVGGADRGDPLGCFRTSPEIVAAGPGNSFTAGLCIQTCQNMYYRIALMQNKTQCYCGEFGRLAEAPVEFCHFTCTDNITMTCGGDNTLSGYATGLRRPGPPDIITVGNITETEIRITWGKPKGGAPATGFLVLATPISTPAPETLSELRWLLSEEIRHAELSNLHPGTKYNVSVSATSAEGPGSPASAVVETVIGEPEPAPPEPEILERHVDFMLIKIPQAVNYNGPVSKYRVVVANKARQRGYLPSELKSFHEAEEEGLPYYITAELDPEDVAAPFVVGNGKTTNGFYNAPLTHAGDVDISIGIVSTKNFVTRIRYARAANIAVLNVGPMDEDASALVTFLGAGVAIGTVLLLIGIGAAVVLRKKIILQRRARMSRSMPLSGPFVEIENGGFVLDEEEKVDHYGDLKRRLWNIPKNFLEVDSSFVVGRGTYGDFYRGRVRHQAGPSSSFVQAIADGEFEKPERRKMLRELDLLIKADGHDHVVKLIGICEHPETLYVALEDCSRSLKESLLTSRRKDSNTGRFCSVSELEILNTMAKICDGMNYLSSKRILHERLCCTSVIIAEGGVPKVSGYGLSRWHEPDCKPDYARWTAVEMFRQNEYTVKSDVWSFGCLMWETVSLGGTPYPRIPNGEVPGKVMKGTRPPQLPYVGDELYQICLHCWQLDLDERPTFSDLLRRLDDLRLDNSAAILSFSYYDGFQYEPYLKELETMS